MDQESKAIISTQARDNTALVLEPELAEAVRRVIAAAESENTRRAYATQFAKFEAWCARRRTSSLPATPAVVAIIDGFGCDRCGPWQACERSQGRDRRLGALGDLRGSSNRRPKPRHEGPRDPPRHERHSEGLFEGADPGSGSHARDSAGYSLHP